MPPTPPTPTYRVSFGVTENVAVTEAPSPGSAEESQLAPPPAPIAVTEMWITFAGTMNVSLPGVV
jgi:hypothetical protein